MKDPTTLLPVKKLIEFCKKHAIIAKLSLFGSALTGKLRNDSNIDLLIEFEPGKTPSFIYLDQFRRRAYANSRAKGRFEDT